MRGVLQDRQGRPVHGRHGQLRRSGRFVFNMILSNLSTIRALKQESWKVVHDQVYPVLRQERDRSYHSSCGQSVQLMWLVARLLKVSAVCDSWDTQYAERSFAFYQISI